MSDQSTNQNTSEPPQERRINPWTVPVLMIIIALGLVVGYNYLMKHAVGNRGMPNDRLPYIGALEKSLILTEKSGEEVDVKNLNGKIFLASYLFTRCPSGCAGIAAEMASVRDLYKDDRLHFLSVSLDPEHDTPEVMQAFSDEHDLGGDDWWHLTGDGKSIRTYMAHQFGFYPPKKKAEEAKLFEDDLFVHDMRIVLVDHRLQIRGYYEVMHPTLADVHVERLRKDVGLLLKEMDKEEKEKAQKKKEEAAAAAANAEAAESSD